MYVCPSRLLRFHSFFLPILCPSLPSCSPGPVPVAPVDWVRDCVESLAPEKSQKRQKILLGLNFYGYDYSTSVQRKP